MMNNGISKAIRLAGSQTALAKIVGVSPQAVQKWEDQGYVPADRCRPVEKAFNGEVTRYELNPKIFGDSPADHTRRKTDKEPQ